MIELKGKYNKDCIIYSDEIEDSATIEKLIEPTASILERVKPILNIKDTGKQISYKERKANKKNRERR